MIYNPLGVDFFPNRNPHPTDKKDFPYERKTRIEEPRDRDQRSGDPAVPPKYEDSRKPRHPHPNEEEKCIHQKAPLVSNTSFFNIM